MPAEQPISGAYFDTPARAERLQLLLHLVRNAGDVIYLRAPAGAGKTRFVHRLLDDLGEEMVTVWIRAGRDQDLPSAIVAQLGLDSTEIAQWPNPVLDASRDQDLLVIVDDADRLDLSAVEDLAALHANGGRLLLVGHGGLAHTTRNWDAQFVDLPSFDAQQTTAFLRAQAGEEAACITEDLAAALHRAAHGLPGPLLEALNEVLLRARKPRPARRAAAATQPGPGWPMWQWLTAGVVLLMLAAALVFQDHINALFQPAAKQRPDPIVQLPARTDRSLDMDRGIESGLALEKATAGLPARPPEIALPRLSQVPADVVPEPPAAAPPGSGIGPPPASAESTAETEPVVLVVPEGPVVVGPPSPAAAEDPLDSVMRDAISAAKAQAPAVLPDEASASDTRVQDHVPVAATPSPAAAGPATPTPVDKPAPAMRPKPLAPEPVPAVVEERPRQVVPATKPAEPMEAAGEPSPAPVETRTAQVAKTESQAGGPDWLKSRDPAHYTLQLVGARDRAAIRKFVRDNAIKQPYGIFERDLEGSPWFSLVAGDYRDRDAAIAARGRLPKPLQQSGVWPRTFESIQKIK